MSLRSRRALPVVQRQKCFQQDIQDICKLRDHKMVNYEVEGKDLQSKPSLAEKYVDENPDASVMKNMHSIAPRPL